MQATIRHLAAAFVVGAIVVLVVDTLLQWSLAAVSPDLGVSGVYARARQHAIWIVSGVLGRATAPLWARWLETVAPAASAAPPIPHRDAFGIVGTSLLVVPCAWLAATWIVNAIGLTLAGSWTTGGRIFLEPYYYSLLVTTYAPWLMAGATLLTLRRHVTDEVGRRQLVR